MHGATFIYNTDDDDNDDKAKIVAIRSKKKLLCSFKQNSHFLQIHSCRRLCAISYGLFGTCWDADTFGSANVKGGTELPTSNFTNVPQVR